MEKEIRGSSFEHMANIEGIDITSLVWKDNKTVTFLSTLYGKLPQSHIERYYRKTKKRLNIACPMLVKQYNKHMGGVDLLDSNIGRYHNTTRSKKWYITVFQHLFDMAVVNSWLLYRRI
ncbi:piggyBac transposable element-derived protein 3-like [Gordionus sp. m RMFG-2023]|uniref:piggyBac transposable element-derived protein 3-like n=1 Tax=Gordionus sp. m RMFG-2023 TaxID=3053472 RepID=UPI0031FE2D6A